MTFCRLEDQSESVLESREAGRCASVGATRKCDVGCRVVIAIVIDRYSHEVSTNRGPTFPESKQ